MEDDIHRLEEENRIKDELIRSLLQELALELGDSSGWWSCDKCGLLNETSFFECAICFEKRKTSSSSSSGPGITKKTLLLCKVCGNKLNEIGQMCSRCCLQEKEEAWICEACLTMNQYEEKVCRVCFADHEPRSLNGKKEEQHEEKVPVLVLDDGWSCLACTTKNAKHAVACEVCFADRPSSSSEAEWTCLACTSKNPKNSVACEVCFADRPSSFSNEEREKEWTCLACTSKNSKKNSMTCDVCYADRPSSPNEEEEEWTCSACTSKNAKNSITCEVCYADHESTEFNEIDLSLDNAREMLTKERAEMLLNRFSGKFVSKIRLSTKSFSEAAAKVAARIISSLRGVCHADFSDIIAGRPEDEALRVLVILCESLHSFEIESVDLSDNALGEKGVRALEPSLKRFGKQVKSLKFRNNGLSGMSMRLLSEYLGRPEKLETLSFFSNMSGDAGAKAIAELVERMGPTSSLRDFCMSSSRVHSAGGNAIIRALEKSSPNLERLDLSDSNFGESSNNEDDVGHNLAVAFDRNAFPRLVDLCLRDVGFHALSITKVVKAATMHAPIALLDLGLCSINAKLMNGSLGECLDSCLSLKELCLVENELGDKGALALAQHLPMNLELLDVSQNEIHRRAAIELAKAFVKRCSHARMLEMNGNRIGNVAGLCEILNNAGVQLGPMDENEADADDDAD